MKKLTVGLLITLMSYTALANMREISYTTIDLMPACMHTKIDNIYKEFGGKDIELKEIENCFVEAKKSEVIALISMDAGENEFLDYYNPKFIREVEANTTHRFVFRHGFQPKSLLDHETYGLHIIEVDGVVKKQFLLKTTFCDKEGCFNNFGTVNVTVD